MIDIFELRNDGNKLRKMALTAMFAAVAVLLSGFSFPVGPSRCFPFQHAVNVLTGILLGPWWALGGAVITSAIRNLLGTGTILAFPGSVFGAVAVGFAADSLPKKYNLLAAAGEPLGTGLIGAWVASLIMSNAGKNAMFALLSGAFLLSSAAGAVIGCMVLVSAKMMLRRNRRRAGDF
jgi:energy coupling factor transporter S component ThiW